jgi:hypothetical protein
MQTGADAGDDDTQARDLAVSKPQSPAEWEAYWKQREARLAEIVAMPDWDSTAAISEDRDRA